MYRYYVQMVGAHATVAIVSPLGNLRAQWQHMRRNDVHTLLSGGEIMMNYTQIVSIIGPNVAFSSLEHDPFPSCME